MMPVLVPAAVALTAAIEAPTPIAVLAPMDDPAPLTIVELLDTLGWNRRRIDTV